ncbi:MAG: hypothetical protein GYA50_04365 [Eubacteriaceae bacterium]|nr:hypothetical protein [Eubacteriaceae bacterium]
MTNKSEKSSIFFLKNADKSLEGLSFKGFDAICCDTQWLSNCINEHDINWIKSRLYNKDSYLTVFIKNRTDEANDCIEFEKHFTTAVNIYFNSNIYIPVCVNNLNDNSGQAQCKIENFPEIYGFSDNNFCELNPDQKDKLQQFLNLYNYEEFESTLKSAVDFFYLCLQSDNINIRFILLISVLETLFSSLNSKSELKYRVTRNMAVFLGRDIENSREIFADMRKFYDYRSDFIHAGITEHITRETFIKLSEYVRLTLKKMIINRDVIGDKKTYLELLNESAFGSNPYNIE